MSEKKVYLPSHYPCDDKTPDEVIDTFIEVGNKVGDLVKGSYKCDMLVKYGEDSMESVDCIYPQRYDEKTAIVIFVHGGYWQETSNANYHFIADQIVKCGKIAVFLETQNAPQATLQTIMEQCRSGLSHIATRMFPHADHVTMCGHSSGGHKLFEMLAHDWLASDHVAVDTWLSARLTDVILVCGVYQLDHLLDSDLNILLKMNREDAHRFSPILHFDDFARNTHRWERCRVNFVYAQHDAPTILEWNEKMIKQVEERSSVKKMFVHKVPDEDHFTIISKLVDSEFSVTKLLCGGR